MSKNSGIYDLEDRLIDFAVRAGAVRLESSR